MTGNNAKPAKTVVSAGGNEAYKDKNIPAKSPAKI